MYECKWHLDEDADSAVAVLCNAALEVLLHDALQRQIYSMLSRRHIKWH